MKRTERYHKCRRIFCVLLLLSLLLGLTGCSKEEAQIHTVSELNGKKIAVESGAVHAAVLKGRSELPDSEILYAWSIADGLAMLLNDKADALSIDFVTAQVLTRRYDGVVMLDETLDSSVYGFAFPKRHALIPLFDETISKLKSDGTIDELEEKWMNSEDDVKLLPEQTWPGKNGVIRCCVSPDNEPMCYIDFNGNLTGFDIDLLLHIAEKLDYRIQFSQDRFEDLIPSVAAGLADVAASGITVSQDRNEIIDFTSGYMEAGTVIVVRDFSAGAEYEGILVLLQNAIRRTLLEQNRWKDLLSGLWMTVKIILLSVFSGAVFGTAIYLLYYSNNRIARCILGPVSKVMHLLPASTWLLASFYLIFSGNRANNFRAAVIAYGLAFGFSVFDALKNSVNSIDAGQMDAAVSMGYGHYEALYRIYLPQALPSFLSMMEVAVLGTIQNTALVEFIALEDFQGVADRIRTESYEPFLTIILTGLVYVFLGLIGCKLVRKLRVRISPSEKSETEIRKRIMKEAGR